MARGALPEKIRPWRACCDGFSREYAVAPFNQLHNTSAVAAVKGRVGGQIMELFSTSAFYRTAAVSVVIFILLDMLWLAVVARRFYFKHFSHLATIRDGKIVFNLYAGIAAQVVIAVGLVCAIVLALAAGSTAPIQVIVGAGAGFAMYATYDLTNLSFVRGYPLLMSVVDIAWGTAQGACAGVYVHYLMRLWS